MYDVIVIGGGIAGSIAAYTLAMAKVRVLILEKEPLPRYKTCGGGVTYRARKMIPYDIDLIIDKEFDTADVYDHENDIRFHVKRNHPILNMTMRENLDYFCLAKAVGNGADFKDKIYVKNLIVNKDYVEAVTDKENFTAKFIIGADGATGVTSRVLGLQDNFRKIPAMENEVYVNDELLEMFSAAPRFDFGIIPHGYGWVFPKKEHLSIGVASMRPSKINMNTYLKSYMETLGITETLEEQKHGYIIPMHPKKKKFSHGRILLAGDAAGLADPVTAEGISYAVETGNYAAEALLRGKFNVETVNRKYNFIMKRVLSELRNAKFLSYFIYHSPSLRKFVFKNYGTRLSELMADVITGEKKYGKLVKNPVNYLKLLNPKYFKHKPLSSTF